MTNLLLEVRNLSVEFPLRLGTVRAVNDVSFDLHKGQVLGIVGESGSGKSVMARSIMGMVRQPGRVTSGSITLEGRNLLECSPEDMRKIRGRQISMVFQDPGAVLNPVMRVGDQVAEALMVHGRSRSESRELALELFRRVGIPDAARRFDAYPHQFSGGMRQRVVIAAALANSPSLVIADEPTTALDVTIQAQILALLAELRDELGVSIMLITHDMGVVAQLCTDMVVMYGGRVVEKGAVADVLRSPTHPYTAALLRSVPRLGDDRQGQRLVAIKGAPPDPIKLPPGCAFHVRCPIAEEGCKLAVPPLLPLGQPGQHSACLVAQRGEPITIAPAEAAATAATRAATVGHRLLEVVECRTDVGSEPRGILGKSPPVYAVDGVSLHVDAGEILGLVGESGCGKSTLARTLVGLNVPAAGRITVEGRDVSRMNSADTAYVQSQVQYIFQDPNSSLNSRRTIRQSLFEALEMRGVAGEDRETEAIALLERVGLQKGHLDRYPNAFSGGQRQRIGIARALARQPRLLICDEPVSALDVSIQAQIINLLADLQRDLGLACLFIAHDLAVVRHISDRVAVMYLGRIVEVGTAEQVYSDPQHPYTVALLSSTPEPEVESDRSKTRIVLKGDLPSPAAPPSGCRFRTRCPIGPLAHPERRICIEQDPSLKGDSAHSRAACHFAGELKLPGAAPRVAGNSPILESHLQ